MSRRTPPRLTFIARIQARVQNRDALIGVFSLGLMLLLAATSLAIFITVNSTIFSTRNSRDIARANQNLDLAEADASYKLNTAPSSTSGTGNSVHNATGYPSNWSWTKTTSNQGVAGGGTIEGISRSGDTGRKRDLPWRNRLVGSINNGPNGQAIYGVAAPSAWTSVISTEDASNVVGTVNGDWHIYGTGRVTIPSGSSVSRLISYDDRSSVQGTPGDFQRSRFSATLDERLLNARVTACGTSLGIYRSSTNPGGAVLNANQIACYYKVIIDVPTTVVGNGVATVISYGDITIASSITSSSANQLHLYTASGTVKFRGNGSVSAYIFAPNALCKSYATTTVTGGSSLPPITYTGSLACRQVEMVGTFNQGAVPMTPAAGVGTPTSTVSYLETPGYRDRFTGTD